MAGTVQGIGRRSVLRATAGTLPLAGNAAAATPRLRITASAAPAPGVPFRAADFAMVGVFDVDWLLDPRYVRLLDHMAASPGAFRGLRCFGVLNSGETEDVFPTSGGRTWPGRDAPMDFSASLDALNALVSRGIVPFLPLTFFPAAIANLPTEPPMELGGWQALVRGFLDQVVARFGAAEVSRWWFEVWNEPNMPPFWRGDFDGYLVLYRATAQAVRESGHRIRLGGPVVAYMPPREGAGLMERFLGFLRDAPDVQCDFLSLHRKGHWVTEEGEPRLDRLVQAMEETGAAALRLVPERCRAGLPIVNDEADMKVGFATPYRPRLTEQHPAWLAAVTVAHDGLNARYAGTGLRFLAAADNANQHLVREGFDGRRALMTPTVAGPADLVKLPVFGFYELLRLLGERHGSWTAEPQGHPGLHHLVTTGEAGIAALLTHYPDADTGTLAIDYRLHDIPWDRVNLAQFRIDADHANAFAAAGGRMPTAVAAGEMARRLRLTQELGVAAPIRSGLRPERRSLHLPLRLEPYATALLWVTPYRREALEPPRWIDATAEAGNVVLRWTPSRDPAFYGYELRRTGPGGRGELVTPRPLRAAMWVDTAPPTGRHSYALTSVSASGIRIAAPGRATVSV